MPLVELYTRAGCCLCDVAKEAIERVRAARPFELRVIDIDTDPRLVALYGWEIPVVVVDGRKHAKLRLDERRFAERLARAASGEAAAEAESVYNDSEANENLKEVSR